jgi:predicted 2-oxoglutarate/Fe(II)-dependent dioxygenase YbiX
VSAFAPSSPRALGGPLVVWDAAFSPAELDRITAYGDGLARETAGLFVEQGDVTRKRITQVAWMERRDDTAWLYRRLEETVQRLNLQFYKYAINGLRERLQYTVYEQAEGGHYDWHVDHGAATPQPRKLSLSLQLTDPGSYEGCDLELSYGDGVKQVPRSRGTVIAFPSYVLHRVTPIVSGTRKSLVTWVSGPDFR